MLQKTAVSVAIKVVWIEAGDFEIEEWMFTQVIAQEVRKEGMQRAV